MILLTFHNIRMLFWEPAVGTRGQKRCMRGCSWSILTNAHAALCWQGPMSTSDLLVIFYCNRISVEGLEDEVRQVATDIKALDSRLNEDEHGIRPYFKGNFSSHHWIWLNDWLSWALPIIIFSFKALFLGVFYAVCCTGSAWVQYYYCISQVPHFPKLQQNLLKCFVWIVIKLELLSLFLYWK